MNGPDIAYYARRAQQERQSAERTDDSIARRVHRELAERYSARLSEIATADPQSVQG